MNAFLSEYKKPFNIAGIIMILLGMGAVALPVFASIAVEVIFGWILIFGGIVTMIHSCAGLRTGSCVFRFTIGLLYTAIGVMFLAFPMTGVLTLTLLLGVLFIFEGIIKVWLSLKIHPVARWGWMLASGVASLLLAFIIFTNYPGGVAWILGLLVGLNLIFSGITMLLLASAAE
ncbi:MAG: hypothetical protein GF408_00655 [Candidatus Omnitrophica bacterium]|nr:hypothetical protein [Candidatus Omnitrophota bacterium]